MRKGNTRILRVLIYPQDEDGNRSTPPIQFSVELRNDAHASIIGSYIERMLAGYEKYGNMQKSTEELDAVIMPEAEEGIRTIFK